MEGVCAPFGRWVGENMCQLNIYICIGYILPTFGGYMTVGGCLCALRALGWERFDKVFLSHLEIAFLILITSRCQIVPFSLRCQIVLVPNCPLFIAVPNCPFYTAVPNCPGAKLSYFTLLVPNCPRCQIVLFYTLGAKLSLLHCGAKLSLFHGGAKLSLFHCGAKLS